MRGGPLSRLYAVLDPEILGGVALRDAALICFDAGVRWLQLRAKEMADLDLYREWEAVLATAPRDAELWVNDRADLARLFGTHLHLGQHDLPPAAARKLVAPGRWIGRSTHDEEQFRAAAADPEVDVIAVGPIFATSTKQDPDPVVGLDALAGRCRSTDKPVVAIGGLDAARAAATLRAGVAVAAVVSGLCRGDLEANLDLFRKHPL